MQGVASFFSVIWDKLSLLLSSAWSDLGVMAESIQSETQCDHDGFPVVLERGC